MPRWLGGQSSLLVAADAEHLPLADESVDLVYSNLMLHWHPEPHTLFPEWRRVLRVDGLLLFSCFGPDTLKELRTACRSAMPGIRPVPFIDMHDFDLPGRVRNRDRNITGDVVTKRRYDRVIIRPAPFSKKIF